MSQSPDGEIRFRTAIEPLSGRTALSHSNHILMVGSCFTDRIGAELEKDGFDIAVNPMGILFNPASLADMLTRAAENRLYTKSDLTFYDGIWHALQYESSRRDEDPERLLDTLNADFAQFIDTYRKADTVIATFGTAFVYRWLSDGRLVGNCHKLPTTEFVRTRMSVDEIVSLWQKLLINNNKRFIFTVSPVRHLADGLHGNQLSKATLLLATEKLGEYFPSYEIINDDLRDYRFYDTDLKHPSPLAIEYIYNIFAKTYFTKPTLNTAATHRREWLRRQHRPILQ